MLAASLMVQFVYTLNSGRCSICIPSSFTAIPKVVNEHKAMAHAVARNWGYDAADIQKWREARRKNYPSGSNVEKRRAEVFFSTSA